MANNLNNCSISNDGIFFTITETSGDTIQDLEQQVFNGETLPKGVYRQTISANTDYHVSASMFTINGNSHNAFQQPPDAPVNPGFGESITILDQPPRCWVSADVFVGNQPGIPTADMGNGSIAKVWMKDTVAEGDVNNKVEVTIQLMDNFVIGDTDTTINLDIDGEAAVYEPIPIDNEVSEFSKSPFDFLITPVAFVSAPHRIAAKQGGLNQYDQFDYASLNPELSGDDATTYNQLVDTETYPTQAGFGHFALPLQSETLLNSSTILAPGVTLATIQDGEQIFDNWPGSLLEDTNVADMQFESVDQASWYGAAFFNSTAFDENYFSLELLDQSIAATQLQDKISFLLTSEDPAVNLTATTDTFFIFQVDEIVRVSGNQFSESQDVTNHPFLIGSSDLTLTSISSNTIRVDIPFDPNFAFGATLANGIPASEVAVGQRIIYRFYYQLLSPDLSGEEEIYIN
jgi:hypothetical protein